MSSTDRYVDWLIYLPLALAGLFGLITLFGSWRRTLTLAMLSFAALVIAAQHNAFLAATLQQMIGQSSFTPQAWNALTFGGSVIVISVLLNVIFRALWKPTSSWQSPGFIGLLWGVIGAGIGWLIGVVLLPALFVLMPTIAYDAPSDLLTKLRVTLRLINTWLTPWVSGNVTFLGID